MWVTVTPSLFPILGHATSRSEVKHSGDVCTCSWQQRAALVKRSQASDEADAREGEWCPVAGTKQTRWYLRRWQDCELRID